MRSWFQMPLSLNDSQTAAEKRPIRRKKKPSLEHILQSDSRVGMDRQCKVVEKPSTQSDAAPNPVNGVSATLVVRVLDFYLCLISHD